MLVVQHDGEVGAVGIDLGPGDDVGTAGGPAAAVGRRGDHIGERGGREGEQDGGRGEHRG